MFPSVVFLDIEPIFIYLECISCVFSCWSMFSSWIRPLFYLGFWFVIQDLKGQSFVIMERQGWFADCNYDHFRVRWWCSHFFPLPRASLSAKGWVCSCCFCSGPIWTEGRWINLPDLPLVNFPESLVNFRVFRWWIFGDFFLAGWWIFVFWGVRGGVHFLMNVSSKTTFFRKFTRNSPEIHHPFR